MRSVRAGLRLLAIVVVTGAHYALLKLGILAARLGRRSDSQWKARMLGRWARAVSRVIGMRVQVEGAPPRPPFLLVANHLSYVDVLLLAAHVPGVFVARGDLARWTVLGRLTRSVGTLYVDREHRHDVSRVIGEVIEALGRNLGVILFPEGTSSDGSDVLPFKPALLDAAARRGLPVSFASLSYATAPGCAPARLAVCWWGDMTFSAHLWDLLSLPGFRARLAFGTESIQHPDRKALAHTLREAVRGRFEPVTT